MTQRVYSSELKAQAIAEMLTGIPLRQIARNHDIPTATLRSWRNVAKAQPLIAREQQEDIGELIYDLIAELAKGARAIARQLQDSGYLSGQSADHLAISLGVAIDKMAGLAGAIERGRRQQLGEAQDPA